MYTHTWCSHRPPCYYTRIQWLKSALRATQIQTLRTYTTPIPALCCAFLRWGSIGLPRVWVHLFRRLTDKTGACLTFSVVRVCHVVRVNIARLECGGSCRVNIDRFFRPLGAMVGAFFLRAGQPTHLQSTIIICRQGN